MISRQRMEFSLRKSAWIWCNNYNLRQKKYNLRQTPLLGEFFVIILEGRFAERVSLLDVPHLKSGIYRRTRVSCELSSEIFIPAFTKHICHQILKIVNILFSVDFWIITLYNILYICIYWIACIYSRPTAMYRFSIYLQGGCGDRIDIKHSFKIKLRMLDYEQENQE